MADTDGTQAPPSNWQALLVETAPMKGAAVNVGPTKHVSISSNSWGDRHVMPDVAAFCGECQGQRSFVFVGDPPRWTLSEQAVFLEYRCRNCRKFRRQYSLLGQLQSKGAEVADILKIGELPGFGTPVPKRVLDMLGADRDLFLQGRRAEGQGLGIGAYAYYRRVVHEQWKRILAEIVKVAKATGADQATLDRLAEAVAEDGFAQSLDKAAGVLPSAMLLEGHNPLRLLNTAVSKGIHELSDEECLEQAGNIRVLLGAMGQRISEIVEGRDELKAAITSLREAERVRK